MVPGGAIGIPKEERAASRWRSAAKEGLFDSRGPTGQSGLGVAVPGPSPADESHDQGGAKLSAEQQGASRLGDFAAKLVYD